MEKTITLETTETFLRGDAADNTLAQVRKLERKLATGTLTDNATKNQMIARILAAGDSEGEVVRLTKDLLTLLYTMSDDNLTIYKASYAIE